MSTRKVTLLLMLTVISLLTMFLVILLDDTVLAGEIVSCHTLPNLNLSPMTMESMMHGTQESSWDLCMLVELNSLEVV